MATSLLESCSGRGLQTPADLRRSPFDEVVDVLVEGLWRLIRAQAHRRPVPSVQTNGDATAVPGAASVEQRQPIETPGESS